MYISISIYTHIRISILHLYALCLSQVVKLQLKLLVHALASPVSSFRIMHREEAKVSLAWWRMAGNPSTFEVKAGGCQPGLREVLSQNVWGWAGLGMDIPQLSNACSTFRKLWVRTPALHKAKCRGSHPQPQHSGDGGRRVPGQCLLMCTWSLRSAWAGDPV